MYIVRGAHNLPERFHGGAVAIGNFDGVHRGHQAMFHTLVDLASDRGIPALALTFEPHPRRVLRPEVPLPRISTVRGKGRWMEQAGIDAMYILRFTRPLASQSPEEFVLEHLVAGLGARVVLVGFNFRFGRGGAGDVDLLARLGRQHGFTVHRQPPFLLDDLPVSSTRVRQAVRERDFAAACRLLGRPFEVEGRVGGGQKRGRSLGFPTANLPLRCLLHPPPGVYIVEGRVGEQGPWLPAVANIGHNPTFGDEGLHLEAHMLQECGDLYRRVLRIRFLKYLRDETRFPHVEALKQRIAQDVAEALDHFTRRDSLPRTS
ncbi:MAG: riboflavin biosynthesis protein RibF [Magnetococcus sp. WYHC-3]